MSTIQEPVQRYIDRLHSLMEARQYRFSQDELMDIAWEEGLTEMDFLQLKEDVFFYLERATAYIEMKKWEDAIGEIEEACTLDPLNPYTLWHKANLYASRWKEEKNGVWRAQAIEVLHYCLHLEPEHQMSLDLLEEMQQWRQKQRKFVVSKALFALGFLLFTALGVVVFQYLSEINSPEDVVQESYVVIAKTIVPSHLIGVQMKVGKVEISHPAASSTQGRIQYKYSGNIQCDSLELGKLFCQVSFLDSNSAVLATEAFSLLDAVKNDTLYNHSLSMHPSDMLSFARQNTWGLPIQSKKTKQVASVIFELMDASARLTDNQFPPYRALRLPWKTRRPYYLRFNAYSRFDSLLLNPYDSLMTHQSQLAIQHNGRKACRYLKVLLEWRNKNGDLLKENTLEVLDTSMMPLQPKGQILIPSTVFFKAPEFNYPKPFERMSIKVLEAY